MPSQTLARPTWPRPAASAAIFRDGLVLLVERGKGTLPGTWSLPGGHIEPGERAMVAALREVGEETGIEADILGLADVHDVLIQGADGQLAAHYVLAVYFGRWVGGEPVAGGDSVAARFVRFDDLDSYRLTPGARPIIARAWELLGALAKP
ncbi:MAG: NUDIX hydrolase [Hyphomicrobiaceae bacterium]